MCTCDIFGVEIANIYTYEIMFGLRWLDGPLLGYFGSHLLFKDNMLSRELQKMSRALKNLYFQKLLAWDLSP